MCPAVHVKDAPRKAMVLGVGMCEEHTNWLGCVSQNAGSSALHLKGNGIITDAVILALVGAHFGFQELVRSC